MHCGGILHNIYSISYKKFSVLNILLIGDHWMLRRRVKKPIVEEPAESKSPIDETHSTSKDINKFNEFYDDSSDEEDIEEKVSTYKINKSWGMRKKDTLLKGPPLSHDELLSFIAHAGGIKLFYSSHVNAIYYPLKKQFLQNKMRESASNQFKLNIKKGLVEAVQETMKAVSEFFERAESTFPAEQVEVNLKKIRHQFYDEVDAIILKYLPDLLKWSKLLKYSQNYPKPVTIQSFDLEITTLLVNLFKKTFLLAKSKHAGNDQEISDLALETSREIINNLAFDKLEKAEGKKTALTLLKHFSTPYKHLKEVLIKILENSPARGYVSNMLEKELIKSQNESLLVIAYIEDLFVNKDLKSKKYALSSQERNVLKNYYTINEESICKVLHNSFSYFQNITTLKAIHQFQRPTLSRNHTFISNNPFQFYANLRLANRSQTRTIANNKHAFLKKCDRISSRLWRLSPQSSELTDVHETQTILKSTLGRRDKVDDVGNYETIYEEIKLIKKYNSTITDRTIALWIKEIFNGNKIDLDLSDYLEKEIFHKLHSITYLLFGCEAVRNPSLHCINQMLLDLIIHDKNWTFEEALTGKNNNETIMDSDKRMPMAPEGAVAISRFLISDYRAFMPYPYFYRGTEDKSDLKDKFNKRDLVKFEAAIVRDWLSLTKFKFTKGMSAPLFAESALKHIEKHFFVWIHPAKKEKDEKSHSVSKRFSP